MDGYRLMSRRSQDRNLSGESNCFFFIFMLNEFYRIVIMYVYLSLSVSFEFEGVKFYEWCMYSYVLKRMK